MAELATGKINPANMGSGDILARIYGIPGAAIGGEEILEVAEAIEPADCMWKKIIAFAIRSPS